jgi:hypothetical protein
MAKSRNGMIIFFREGDIIGQGCGVGTFLFDPYNSAGQWGGNVTGDGAEAVLSPTQFTFKLNAGSLDSTFVLTQLHFMQITGGTYYAFSIEMEIAGGSGTSTDGCLVSIETTTDGGSTYTMLLADIPIFFTDKAAMASGSLPVGTGQRFGIRITAHLTSPDALQPVVTIKTPLAYCCDGIPLSAPDMSSYDTPEALDETKNYHQFLSGVVGLTATPVSWSDDSSVGTPGNAGEESVDFKAKVRDDGTVRLDALIDLHYCREFTISFDATVDNFSPFTGGVSIGVIFYSNDGFSAGNSQLQADLSWGVGPYFFTTGSYTSDPITSNVRYVGLQASISPNTNGAAGSTAALLSPEFTSNALGFANYWVNEDM